MEEKRTTWNTKVPTYPGDTEAMVGIALGLKEKEKKEKRECG